MRFFARLVCICNVCFIAAAILRLVEMRSSAKGNEGLALKFQPLESTIVILGYGAIFLNIFFILGCLYWLVVKKINLIPRWVLLFNLVVFPIQIYFFFFSNF
jgi:hypothetical protein